MQNSMKGGIYEQTKIKRVMDTSRNFIRDFEKETRTYLDVEKQIKQEDKEKEIDFEI